ncbi:MAG: sigma 54-interacting transcriptional regulator [Candidatus Eisenbacteria bacterium]|uniref:Sigma 54-interacting transcriptional regulator n=1 Tax=Eiseniibacteriota bacterium TaxID=2212470 RepID=A0A956LX60_UNCEI|nr:sigma 54-interacting transcriptional regulator [Candidatus Eisenbacteria bacterium]
MTQRSEPNDRASRAAPSRASVADRIDAGDLYARVGDHTQALITYLGAWPEVSEAETPALARRIAYCQGRLGRYAEAIGLLEPVVASLDVLDVDRVELGKCYNELGSAYFALGDLDRAQSAGLTAAKHLAKTTGPHFGVAQNLLGGVALRSGDTDLARTHFRAALDHFRTEGDVGNLAFAYNNLGHVYKAACEWERALEHYQAAYYLCATEGEYQDQGAIHQNLGVTLLKIGRYAEAQEHLEKSRDRAMEMGDSVRVLRARIALVRLARESRDFQAARRILREARSEGPDAVPSREACLLMLEDASLAFAEGRLADSRALLAPLFERVAAMASRGDLMVEAHLLQANLALEEGAWDEARHSVDAALELSRADHDREQENRALAAHMRWSYVTGATEDAEKAFQEQRAGASRRGERPFEARLLEWRAGVAREFGVRSEQAVALLGEARDLWRSMRRERVVFALTLQLAAAELVEGRRDRAIELLESLGSDFGTDERSAALHRRISRMLEAQAEVTAGMPDGEWVLRRLEEIRGWDASRNEVVRECLSVLVETLGADGGLVGKPEAETLELVSTVSMGRLGGRRQLTPSTLGIPGTGASGILEPTDPSVRTSMAVRVSLDGVEHCLYVERRQDEARRFTLSDLRYATLVAAEVARMLPPPGPGEKGDAGHAFDGIRHGIYVADIITQDPKMLAILGLIRKVAGSDLTVLLQGETGTGKKLLAQALHRISERRDRGFVTVDCAALPDNLLESELFGHRRGAFTGAVQDRIGLLEEANGGTVFLDEIDKAGISVQRRFLHLLDSGEIRPVGATGYRPLDVRVVCATSCPDLRSEVSEGRFIKDLYYRLNDIAISVPPLRERPDDLPLLTGCFIESAAHQAGREIAGVAPAFHEVVQAHDWPGNVRELEKAIRRAVALVDAGGTLVPDLLPVAVIESSGRRAEQSDSLKGRVEAFERSILLETLDRVRWNKSRAAEVLGLTRKGLKGKIERYGLDRRRGRR